MEHPARIAIVDRLQRHPRVQQQELGRDRALLERLASSVPPVIPFGGRQPHKVVALLDWDHRLPSKKLTLRLHVFYDAPSLSRFEIAIGQRLADIKQHDLFPEFDVPDLADLPGDESYDAELTDELTVESMRLVSGWRRELDPKVGEITVEIVRDSKEFADVRAASVGRSSHLGDLEAVSWTPPCESSHATWTVDVWWLTAFDGRLGRGWSFLVDPTGKLIISHREFTVRTG